MGKLDGRPALVTGASRGLGAGIALAFADEGADVAVNYVRRKDKADEVVDAIRARGRRAIAVQADCSREDDVERMVNTVLEEFGEIRILMNNAGILTQIPFDEMPVSAWDEMMASHLRSHFLVTRACVPSMLQLKPLNNERRAAKIITMSSGIGQKGGAGGATIVHYVTAKAGIIGFTKALAGELAPLITVNSISPGTHPDGHSRRPQRRVETGKGEAVPSRLRNGRGRGAHRRVHRLARCRLLHRTGAHAEWR